MTAATRLLKPTCGRKPPALQIQSQAFPRFASLTASCTRLSTVRASSALRVSSSFANAATFPSSLLVGPKCPRPAGSSLARFRSSRRRSIVACLSREPASSIVFLRASRALREAATPGPLPACSLSTWTYLSAMAFRGLPPNSAPTSVLSSLVLHSTSLVRGGAQKCSEAVISKVTVCGGCRTGNWRGQTSDLSRPFSLLPAASRSLDVDCVSIFRAPSPKLQVKSLDPHFGI
mmetsp:Transcript_10424/g.18575  ORF Transcript_10424/g.18575 Transcript_10424/m.18575 type:complete len:233 (-) Transcript_10424:1438-2136(-)